MFVCHVTSIINCFKNGVFDFTNITRFRYSWYKTINIM